MQKPITFTQAGMIKGVIQMIPFTFGVIIWSAIFGILARQQGLSLWEAGLMSGAMFSGAAQFIALDLWELPLPTLTMVLATLVVSLRFTLMGLSLGPWVKHYTLAKKFGLAFVLTDANWATTLREFTEDRTDVGYFVGSGLLLYLCWLIATIVGYLASTAIQNPAQYGLDFAFTAAFIALVAGFWRGKASWLPWGVAAAVAIICAQFMPEGWHILVGGLAGSLVGAMRHAE